MSVQPKAFCFLLLVCKVGWTTGYFSGEFMLAADATNRKIHQISLTSGSVVALSIPGLTKPTGVIYDKENHKVVVADHGSKTLIRCNLAGTSCKSFSTGRGYPLRMATDYSTGNIYYSADETPEQDSSQDGYIGVINPTDNSHIYLLGKLRSPDDIALHPSKGYMFWTDDASENDHIGRSYMDGTSSIRLITQSSIRPYGIAIDYSTDRLYWVDAYYDRLQSSDLNGGNRLSIIYDIGSTMSDVLVRGSYLYYSAEKNKYIRKVRKGDYGTMSWMSSTSSFGIIYSIDAYPPDTQPLHTKCSTNNGGCDAFCMPSGTTSRTCYCDGGIGLTYNNFYNSECKDSAVKPNTGMTLVGTVIFLHYIYYTNSTIKRLQTTWLEGTPMQM